MIPLRIFWLFDAAILTLAFVFAYGLVPRIMQTLMRISPSMREIVFAISQSVATGVPALLLKEVMWVLPVTAPITLLALSLLGNHRPLLNQSKARIVVGSFFAPIVGVSFAALVLVAFKNSFASRLLIFAFALVGGLGLSLYRLTLRRYFGQRRAAGYTPMCCCWAILKTSPG